MLIHVKTQEPLIARAYSYSCSCSWLGLHCIYLLVEISIYKNVSAVEYFRENSSFRDRSLFIPGVGTEEKRKTL